MMDYNSTRYMDDPFGDVGEEMFPDDRRDTVYIVLYYTLLVTNVIKLILCLSTIIADILLIYAITKFRRLKSTVNCYIRHYAIFNILHLLGGPLVHLVYGEYESCLEHAVDKSALIFNFLFAFGLGFDWLTLTFKPEIGMKIGNFYKYSSLSLYVIGCLMSLGFCVLCYRDFSHLRFLSITYLSVLLFILVLDYLTFKHKNAVRFTKPVYSLTVANIIVLFWLPAFVDIHLHELLAHKEMVQIILSFIMFIPEWLSCSISLVIVVVLVNVDKHFKMSFAKIFRKSLRNYNGDNESLDKSEGRVTYPETNSNAVYNSTTASVELF